MTSPVEIEEALFAYLADEQITLEGSPVQIVWLNQVQDRPKVPRLAVDRTADSNRTLGLSTSAVLKSSLVLTVVTESGEYIKDRNTILRSIYEKFPLHQEIGAAIITRLPEARPGFRDGSEYRTPVFVEYTAIIQN